MELLGLTTRWMATTIQQDQQTRGHENGRVPASFR
jgi:hypothetical protein